MRIRQNEQKPTAISPRLRDPVIKWLEKRFSSRNAGAEFILEAFPVLLESTLANELRGRFLEEELCLIVEVSIKESLLTSATAHIIGRHLCLNLVGALTMNPELKEKYRLDHASLCAKIEALTCFQQAALEAWAAFFWQKPDCAQPGMLRQYCAQLL